MRSFILLTFIFLTFLLTSCKNEVKCGSESTKYYLECYATSSNDIEQNQIVDVNYYAARFRDECLKKNCSSTTIEKLNSVSFQLKDYPSDSHAVGTCIMSRGSLVITIRKSFWYKDSTFKNYAREALIFHEIGHCVLNREHFTTGEAESLVYENYKFKSFIDRSYMNHLIGDERHYRNYRSYYIDELFNQDIVTGDNFDVESYLMAKNP